MISVILLLLIASVNADVKEKAIVQIQATNATLVPNILYTVDAVECLKEACSIYADDQSRAEAFAELFATKHAGKWNVAVGYTTIITHSTIYVECLVEGEKDFLYKDKKDKGLLYRIFN